LSLDDDENLKASILPELENGKTFFFSSSNFHLNYCLQKRYFAFEFAEERKSLSSKRETQNFSSTTKKRK
jgi:hypothetical protein